jgi:hypothetical protein
MCHGIDLRVENDLGDSMTIAQIDENKAAVIAPTLHPAHQDHRLPEVVRIQNVTIVTPLPIAQ